MVDGAAQTECMHVWHVRRSMNQTIVDEFDWVYIKEICQVGSPVQAVCMDCCAVVAAPSIYRILGRVFQIWCHFSKFDWIYSMVLMVLSTIYLRYICTRVCDSVACLKWRSSEASCMFYFSRWQCVQLNRIHTGLCIISNSSQMAGVWLTGWTLLQVFCVTMHKSGCIITWWYKCTTNPM